MLQGIRNEGQEPVPDIVSYLEKRLGRAAERGNPEEAWLVNRNNIIDVPMETGIADWDKAVRALDRMYSEEFVGRYGVWLDSLGRRECMTITTRIMAVAQANYGYCDSALELVKKSFPPFPMPILAVSTNIPRRAAVLCRPGLPIRRRCP